jgi:hypothetical protein
VSVPSFALLSQIGEASNQRIEVGGLFTVRRDDPVVEGLVALR